MNLSQVVQGFFVFRRSRLAETTQTNYPYSFDKLLARLAAIPLSEIAVGETQQTMEASPVVTETSQTAESNADEGRSDYWLTPVKSDETQTAEEVVAQLVAKAGIYAFGENTPGRKRIKVGDWICFYATGKGVIAHAQIASLPEKKPHPKVRDPEKYPWTFQVKAAQMYGENPLVIDADIRGKLEAFKKYPSTSSPWAWFVQATRRVSEHDFLILTRQ